MDEDEGARLDRVYGTYASDAATQARWDPAQPGNRLILAERDHLLRMALGDERGRLVAQGRSPALVDVGCGDGDVLASVSDQLTTPAIGVDRLVARLEVARGRHPTLRLAAADGRFLPLRSTSVDVVLLFTVFSSIRDGVVVSGVADEVRRVVRPGGAVIWYDLRRGNPRNPEVRGVSSDEIARHFPGWHASLRTCTVLPPLARGAARVTPRSYALLARIGALHSHHFGVLRRPA